jgi:uncharacterized protein YkwD
MVYLQKIWQKVHVLLMHWMLPHHHNQHQAKSTHHHSLAWYVIVTLLAQSFLFLGITYPTVHVHAGEISTQKLLEYTNIERRAAGLEELTVNSVLNSGAKLKAEHILQWQYWAHEGPPPVGNPQYKTPWDWFEAVEYKYKFAGENLAVDFASSEGVHQGWMNSPTHRENIMRPEYREVGFAILPGVFQGSQTILIIQLFGTPEQATLTPQIEEVVEAPVAEPKYYEPPEILTPSDGFQTNDPYFVLEGLAHDNESIDVKYNDDTLGRVSPTDQGNFSYKQEAALDEGMHLFSAYGKNAQKSSEPHRIIIDQTAPQIHTEQIRSLHKHEDGKDLFDVLIPVTGDPFTVMMSSQHGQLKLSPSNDVYVAKVAFRNKDRRMREYPTMIVAEDMAGNVITVPYQLSMKALPPKEIVPEKPPVKIAEPIEKTKEIKDEDNEDNEDVTEPTQSSEDDQTPRQIETEVEEEILSKEERIELKEQVAYLTSKIKQNYHSDTVDNETGDNLRPAGDMVQELEFVQTELNTGTVGWVHHQLLQFGVTLDLKTVQLYIKRVNIGVQIFVLLLGILYLAQSYVYINKGVKHPQGHPLFHGILCMSLFVVMLFL